MFMMDCSAGRFIIITSAILVVVSGAPVRVVTAKYDTYIVSDTKVPFASISSGCSSLSGFPTTLTSNQQYLELVEALAQTDPPFLSSFWLSLTKDSKTEEWSWEDEVSDPLLWFNEKEPTAQEPNNIGDNCNSLDLCICGSLTYSENSTQLTSDTHKLFDTCCTESHYFFCKDLNECACSTTDGACVAPDCQEPTSQCLDLIGSYRCIDSLPSPCLTFDTTPTTFSVGSQVTLNCTIPNEDIPYEADIPKDTQWAIEWTRNGESVGLPANNGSLFTIVSLGSDTEGSFECLYHIGGVHSAKSNALDITVRPLTTPTSTSTTTDAAIGEIVNLTCSTSSPGEKLYEWTLPSGATHQTSQETFSFEMTGWQMLGFYTCRVEIPLLESTSLSSDSFVLGLQLAKPVLITKKGTKSFAVNETVTLQCTTADSTPLPWLVFNWEKDGENIGSICCTPEFSFIVSHASIEGVYICYTKYGTKRSQTSNKMTLHYKWSSVPELHVNSTTVSPSVTVQFKCQSEEPGNITFTILKDDKALVLDTTQCTDLENSLHQQCLSLSVKGAEDLGTYFCKSRVESSWSSLSNPVVLIAGQLGIPILTAELHTATSNSISLICSIDANGTYCESCHDFIYTFRLKTDNGTTIEIGETTKAVLNITLATSKDEGDYWCTVKQEWLVSNKSNVLHLSPTKYEVAIETSAVLIPKGKGAQITCSPNWDEPQPHQLRWFKDSHQIKSGTESSLNIKGFHEKYEGAYTCQVYSTVIDDWISSNSTTLTLSEHDQLCTCPCSNTTVEVKLTEELIKQSTTEIEKDLINTDELSNALRKKSCAADDRVSSTACGGVSIFLLVVIIAFVIYLDGVDLSKLRRPWKGMESKNHMTIKRDITY